jgi:predicted alpha/beta-fold hydrolase
LKPISTGAYRPGWLLRNGHLQTFLASSGLRARGPNPMLDCARDAVVETAQGIRLLGSWSIPQSGRGKALAVLLHGWEGSMDSTYVRCLGRALFRRGYAVFRLNFRDHGRSHHLNSGIFYAAFAEEVYDAVRQAALAQPALPVFLVGFSLGGNFALRIALLAGRRSTPALKHVVAVSPVLDPQESTARADRHPVVRRYFMNKWRRSLALKQQLFPDLYDFSDVIRSQSIRQATDLILERYSGFPSATAYFLAYTLTGDALGDLAVPATLVTACDDPIIPVEDFHALRAGPESRVVIHPHGGHNGFLEGLGLRSRYESCLPRMFDAMLEADDGAVIGCGRACDQARK